VSKQNPPVSSPYSYPPGVRPRKPSAAKSFLIVVVVLAAVVGGAAYWVSQLHLARPDCTNATPADNPDPGSTHGGDLLDLLLPAPSDSQPWPRGLPTEAIDVDQAASSSGDPTARANFLRGCGFLRGAVARWVATTGTYVNIRLFQFDSIEDAGRFYAADNRINTDSHWGTPTAVNPIGGASYMDWNPDQNGYVDGLHTARRGDIVIIVIVSQRRPGFVAEGQQLLLDQYVRL
jgi:hypothetical protein